MLRLLFFPIIKKHRKLMFSIFFMAALGIAVMVGLSSAYTSFNRSISSFMEETGNADLVVNTQPFGYILTRKLSGIEGIEKIQGRLAYDTVIQNSDGRHLSARAFTFSDNDFLHFSLIDGKSLEEDPQVLISKAFAENNNISPGSTVYIRIGSEMTPVTVDSVVTSSECINETPLGSSMGGFSDFGYIFIDRMMIYNTDYFMYCNQLLITLKEGADPDVILKAIEEKLGEGIVNSHTCFEDSSVYEKIALNSHSIHVLSVTCPAAFFTIVLVVLLLFVILLIKQYRKEIGILLAFGFSPGGIRALFCFIIVLVSVLGSVLGVFGAVPLCNFVTDAYLRYFSISNIILELNTTSLVIAVSSTVLISVVASFGATRLVKQVNPAEVFSRGTADGSKVPGFVKRLGVSPIVKVNLYSALRSKSRFLFTIVCFAATIVVIFASLSFKLSKDRIMKSLFEDRIRYDCQIILKEDDPRLLERLSSQGYVHDIEVASFYPATFTSSTAEVEEHVYAFPKDFSSMNLSAKDGKRVEVPEKGIVLAHPVAEMLNVVQGDTVLVNGVPVTVAAISSQSASYVHFVSLEQAESLGKPEYWAVFCKTENQNKLLNLLVNEENYLFCMFTDLIYKSSRAIYSLYDVAISLLLFFSALIGFVTIVNALRSIMIDRKKDLCVLMSMGFQINQIVFHSFLQSLIQFAMALCIGFPCGMALAGFICNSLGDRRQVFEYTNNPKQFLLTAVITLIYIILGHLMTAKDMLGWHLSEEVKERE